MTLLDGRKLFFTKPRGFGYRRRAGNGRQIHGLRRMKHGEELPPEAQVIANGWDHEHCELCNTHIDPGDYAYTKTDDLWVCLPCFENPKNGTLVNDL
jgi:hypothetical protein